MPNHIPRRHVMALAMALGASAILAPLGAQQATAQDWPTRPIEIAVFSSAGGGTDLANRVLGAAMEAELGSEVRVSNMTGGRGGVAANHVFSGPKDGHRWLGASSTLELLAVRGAHPTTHKDWHYFLLSSSPSVLTVPVDSPYQSFDELYAAVQENPGKVRISPISAGAPTHILMEALRTATDFDYNFIPYDGSYPTMVAAVAGEIDAAAIPLAEASGYIADGHLRPLVMLEDRPYEVGGEQVPAIVDWVPEMSRYLPMPVWFGFMLPKDTPDEIVEQITVAFDNVVKRPEIQEYVANTKTELLGLTGAEAEEIAARQERVHSWILYDLDLVPNSPEDFGIERP